MKNWIRHFVILLILVALPSCMNKKFDHKEPLIKEDYRKTKKEEIQKTAEMGPRPIFGDTTKLKKRKLIDTELSKNYLVIPDQFANLKSNVSFKFQNLDFKEAIKLMSKVGKINILVGDEVAGSISAELINVPWDKAFNALLDMKNFAADIDVHGNLIKIQLPDTLTQQEEYKSGRAEAIKKKIETENSIEPTVSEIFRLYYISPAQAKSTLGELFKSDTSTLQITEETVTRSIIVRGKLSDINTVEKVLKEIDIRTKQVLIEAFIVEVNSDFERALGTRLGGYKNVPGKVTGGVVGGSTGSGNSGAVQMTDPTLAFEGTVIGNAAGLGTATDSITNFPATGATSGIGIIRKFGTSVLKLEITALESLGLGRTISNPKVFTLDNQLATITQGQEIPYQTTTDGTTTTAFKEAALRLEVTPSIVGDGNILLSMKVNRDYADASSSSDEPPINKMEINTKLLIADGDIVVIGGVKKEEQANATSKVPVLGDLPVVGNLFKGQGKTDDLRELLIFISPKIL